MTFNDLLANLVTRGVSDIHIHVGRPLMARLHGQLTAITEAPLTPQYTASLIDVMCDEQQKAIFAEKKQVDLAYSVAGLGRFRVNLFKQRNSVSCVMRVVNSDEGKLKVVSLPPETINYFRDQEKGLVLVTGPTGSGKSTTLARIIDEMNQHHAKMIVTLEDPIEYLHKGKRSIVVQRELRQDTHSFKDGLVAAMRQDPDVIMIGEIRDHATAAAALEAAQTGHLVFSTLHTLDSVRTVNRVLDLFPPHERDVARVLFADSLVGIVSQRLLPRKGGGRVCAMEIMKGNLRIRDLIKDPNRTNEIYEALKDSSLDGMQTFDDHLAQLYSEDKLDLDVALANATSAQYVKVKALQINSARQTMADEGKRTTYM
ncbi:MAG: PilT/PilU family type 4a pilus ATPase [Meiothermus sp.]|nr:PilT/PilU family type 4a pilus ATPase [Meiothermus sp.]